MSSRPASQLLDKKHSLAEEEVGRLRAAHKLQEEDREFLVRQTVALKRDNAMLRNQLAAALQVRARARPRSGGGKGATGGTGIRAVSARKRGRGRRRVARWCLVPLGSRWR